jgi:hypothetical protein
MHAASWSTAAGVLKGGIWLNYSGLVQWSNPTTEVLGTDKQVRFFATSFLSAI